MRKSVQGMLGTVCLIIPVFASLHVEAQQQCTDRLLAPDVKFNFSDTRSRSYFRDIMCSLDFNDFRTKYGADTGAKYMDQYSGTGNFSKDSYESTRHEQCEDRTSEENKSALAYSSSSVIPRTVRILAD